MARRRPNPRTNLVVALDVAADHPPPREVEVDLRPIGPANLAVPAVVVALELLDAAPPAPRDERFA